MSIENRYKPTIHVFAMSLLIAGLFMIGGCQPSEPKTSTNPEVEALVDKTTINYPRDSVKTFMYLCYNEGIKYSKDRGMTEEMAKTYYMKRCSCLITKVQQRLPHEKFGLVLNVLREGSMQDTNTFTTWQGIESECAQEAKQ